MPTYEYSCQKCGHEFEVFHAISATLKTCPEDKCARKKWGRGKVTKKIGAGAGLLFKGGGFYITDYRSKNYKEGAKKDTAPKAPEAKAEAKPAKSSAKPDK